MKKTILMLTIVFFTINTQAKIWRVNNTAGITSDFTTAQAAHDGATAGDTLHFEPSAFTYGDLTMSKKLVVISTGKFLDIDTANQYSVTPGYIDALTINSTAAGSIIMVNTNNGIVINGAANITIQRCYITGFGSLSANGANTLTIKQCFVDVNTDIVIQSLNTTGSSSVVITNNIIRSRITVNQSSQGINITHNLIGKGCDVINSTVKNNIFSSIVNSHFFNASIVENNLFALAITSSGLGFTGTTNASTNKYSISMTSTFINGGTYNVATTADAGYKLLLPNSPAIGAGVGGVDCGPFGGTIPYKLAVQPPVPAIYKLTVPASTGNTLNVTLSTKSNN